MFNTAHKKVSLFLILISIFYVILAINLPTYPYIPVDSEVVPVGLGVVLFGLSAALYFIKDEEKENHKTAKKEWAVVLTVLIFVLLYIVFLDVLGFLLVTLLFLFFCTWFLGYKHFVANAIVSVVVSCGLYFLFTQFLKVTLPQGILPF
ncbi:MAG TPA: tripartite tricarboxylate transporter TctB family protein [Bacillales bacterium]|nr:tripartite tricarboxylate transporter TctB family protein [Bacillales bacterium]